MFIVIIVSCPNIKRRAIKGCLIIELSYQNSMETASGIEKKKSSLTTRRGCYENLNPFIGCWVKLVFERHAHPGTFLHPPPNRITCQLNPFLQPSDF